MELNELHVLKGGAGVIRKRVSVAGVLPAVARDAERSADSTGRQHDGLGCEQLESSPLAIVTERTRDTIAVL